MTQKNKKRGSQDDRETLNFQQVRTDAEKGKMGRKETVLIDIELYNCRREANFLRLRNERPRLRTIQDKYEVSVGT
jgi:hypothetical protein